MALLNWQLWDRVRAFARKTNIYRTDNIFQDQDAIDRIISNGNFLDFSKQSSLLEQTNLQINRLERYKDYDMMDECGEVTLALDLYADEASLVDPERKHTVIVRAANKRIQQIVEDFLYNTLLIDREVRPMVRYLCKYGDIPFEIVPTRHRDGVASIRHMNIYNFTRVQTKFGDLIGFYYQDPVSMQPVFMHPWQVVHMRLTSYEQLYHPYGRSILDGGRKDFKRLRLMEDAALVYRLTRAPEKRVFSIPVGNIAPNQVQQYIQNIARTFKKTPFIDPATGQINERYNPLIQDDDFFLPKRPDGSGPEVTTLPGAENLDQIADIEYFKKKMIAATKIPFNRVGIGDPAESDGKSLASVSPEFAKNIQWIQREIALGLKKLCIVHLALRGHPISDLKHFDLVMTAASAIDELYRIETWNTRADIIGNLKETGLFPDYWILGRFTDMTREEIDAMEREVKKARESQQLAGIGGLGGMELGEGRVIQVDDDEKELLSEYAEFEQRANNRVIDIPDTFNVSNASKFMTITEQANAVESTANIDWYVNSKELDALPDKNGTPLVEWSVDEGERNEVLSETRMMLMGEVVGSDISKIVSELDANANAQDVAKVISEDAQKSEEPKQV